ncbi:hypothetical protein AAOGI_18580 [Agarivorans albus]
MLYSVDRLLRFDQIIVDNLCLYFSLMALKSLFKLGFVYKRRAESQIVNNF